MKDKKGNLLIIDDDQYWRDTIRISLEEAGYSAYSYANYEEGKIEAAKCAPVKGCKYDAVVIDLMLEHQNPTHGLALCEISVAAGRPVVVVTGMVKKAIPRSLRDNPAISIICKADFSPSAFVELIKNLLNPTVSRTHQTLLFISDLHAQPKKDYYISLAEPLCDDIGVMRRQGECGQIDYLVISGDIAHTGTKEEYAEALKFIDELTVKLKIDRRRIVLVPGNHDMDWKLSQVSYRFCHKIFHKHNVATRVKIYGEELVLIEDSKLNLRRFENFSKFYSDVTGRNYPQDLDSQSEVIPYCDDKLLFLGMNTCCQLDLFHRSEQDVGINPTSFLHALNAQRSDEYAGYVKIALSHHPLHIVHDDVLNRLSKSSFVFCLNGHTHKMGLQQNCINNVHGVTLVSCGSLGAEWKYRPEDVSRQYNIIEIDQTVRTITVKARKRDPKLGPWNYCYIFQAKNGKGLDWKYSFSY